MDRKTVICPKAPRPLGQACHAVEAGELIFLSGQVGLDQTTNKLAPGGPAGQVAQCLENIKAILASIGLDLMAVVRTTIFLTDLNDFGPVNAVYAGYFPAEPPAFTCLEVKALPLGASVAVEAIAAKLR